MFPRLIADAVSQIANVAMRTAIAREMVMSAPWAGNPGVQLLESGRISIVGCLNHLNEHGIATFVCYKAPQFDGPQWATTFPSE